MKRINLKLPAIILSSVLVIVILIWAFQEKKKSPTEILQQHIKAYKNATDEDMEIFYQFEIKNYQLSDEEYRIVFFNFFEEYYGLDSIPDIKKVDPDLIIEFQNQYTEFFYRYDDYFNARMLPDNSKLIAHYLLENIASDLMNNYPAMILKNTTFDRSGILADTITKEQFIATPCINKLNLKGFAISVDFFADGLQNSSVFALGKDKLLLFKISDNGTMALFDYNSKNVLKNTITYKTGEWFRVTITYLHNLAECNLFVDNQYKGNANLVLPDAFLNKKSNKQLFIRDSSIVPAFNGLVRNIRIFSTPIDGATDNNTD